jgi:molybdopterin converting factor small subunit
MTPLRVLFLGPLRDQVGCGQVEMSCPPDGSQGSFWKALREKVPAFEGISTNLRLARNGEFLEPSMRMQPGDEIALIPPVSGG